MKTSSFLKVDDNIKVNWESANPILPKDVLGIETDTENCKLGDGVTAWNSLNYFVKGNTSSVVDNSLTWTGVGNNSFTAGNRGLVINHTSQATVQMYNIGNPQYSIVRYVAIGTGGLLITQKAGQQILFNTSATTVGTGGSLASTANYCAIELLCIEANTKWVVLSSVGTFTVT